MSSNRRVYTTGTTQFALFTATVTRVQRLSEHFVRITLADEFLDDYSAFQYHGNNATLDGYIKLLIPPPGQSEPVVIGLNDSWREEWLSAPEHERGWMRTYTVRAARWGIDQHKNIPEIDIDFVLHQDEAGSMGPGSAWATNTQVGDRISFLGPCKPASLWASWNLQDATRVLICADETAAPAAFSIIRELPPQVALDALIEVPAGEGELPQELADCPVLNQGRENLTLHWMPRAQHGERGQLLEKTLRAILGVNGASVADEDAPAVDEPYLWQVAEGGSDTYIFIAGEAGVVRNLRRICVNEAGIDKKSISFMGYWRAGRAES
ncbi:MULTISPECIES: siderophore-interacting protein [unclassified Rothia (in: high G+C Gram-positive bacteria)]|uniref:siderophore-interacting protein n=1 Tax=unclassified Rothia (in: high G+C Gram-positive bacteria) TaxID=2689056 RepID=UPI001956604A|nr:MULTISPECIES: siderophore-interacting protein [unclassified Rothia (in: high G+C Gram-positive bacteria)]MBM7051533.1 siderophore-interacting protein [Rothia sp. ZJ1223]QRZ61312.1 siderophore-interacting protein [Rothia sp. ZJ932]